MGPRKVGWQKEGTLPPRNQMPETATLVSWSSLAVSKQGLETSHHQTTEGTCRNVRNHPRAKPKEEGREEVFSESVFTEYFPSTGCCVRPYRVLKGSIKK